MNEITNLIYSLEINYVNNSGITTSIHVRFHDDGLSVKRVKIGDVCITEETINGRVLSGKFENLNEYCGYRYDYKNGKKLLNINSQIPIDTAVSLINKKKMGTDFLTAKLVLSSLLRNDYRVVILNKGRLNISKTITAQNEKSEHCSLQKCAVLLKLNGEEQFIEQDKKIIYRIDDCVIENLQILEDDYVKSRFIELSTILSQNPQNYQELIEIKKQIQNMPTITEEKTL